MGGKANAMSKPGRIPVKAAEKLSKDYKCPVVIVFALEGDGSSFCVTTYGASKALCRHAADLGNKFSEAVLSGVVVPAKEMPSRLPDAPAVFLGLKPGPVVRGGLDVQGRRRCGNCMSANVALPKGRAPTCLDCNATFLNPMPPELATAPAVETVEVGRDDLRVGDVLISKLDPGRTFLVEKIDTGANGHDWPYLVMRGEDGAEFDHDTSFDGLTSSYTIRKR